MAILRDPTYHYWCPVCGYKSSPLKEEDAATRTYECAVCDLVLKVRDSTFGPVGERPKDHGGQEYLLRPITDQDVIPVLPPKPAHAKKFGVATLDRDINPADYYTYWPTPAKVTTVMMPLHKITALYTISAQDYLSGNFNTASFSLDLHPDQDSSPHP